MEPHDSAVPVQRSSGLCFSLDLASRPVSSEALVGEAVAKRPSESVAPADENVLDVECAAEVPGYEAASSGPVSYAVALIAAWTAVEVADWAVLEDDDTAGMSLAAEVDRPS